MTGKELIEKLDSMVGKTYTFAVGDVIFAGKIHRHEGGVSVGYKVGDTLFLIYPNKKYKFSEIETIGTTIYIDEVK